MFKKIPFLLLMLVVLVFTCGGFLPSSLAQFLLGVSVTLKSVIVFLLPIIIFSLLFCTFYRIGRNASWIMGLTLLLVCGSNFVATFATHFVGEAVYGMQLALSQPPKGHELQPLFNFQIPKLIPNALAMLMGMVGGILAPKLAPGCMQRFSTILDCLVARLLRVILCMIPAFLLGFLLKMQHDGLLALLVCQYASTIVVIIFSLAIYLLLFYLIANGFCWRKTLISMRNMLPPVICAFGSMSSAAALPYTLVAVEKNTTHKSLARSIVSATTNIHLMGDCIIDTILIYAILRSYNFAMPSTALFLTFTFQFVLAKFSVAAVPGGGIIVMLPIIEHTFGFDGAMSSLIFSMYLLLDPIATSANVLGNGAFAQLVDRMVGRAHIGDKPH
jgi:Na+/H+-dicarboxylate symporter